MTTKQEKQCHTKQLHLYSLLKLHIGNWVIVNVSYL